MEPKEPPEAEAEPVLDAWGLVPAPVWQDPQDPEVGWTTSDDEWEQS